MARLPPGVWDRFGRILALQKWRESLQGDTLSHGLRVVGSVVSNEGLACPAYPGDSHRVERNEVAHPRDATRTSAFPGSSPDLRVKLGRLALSNPVLVASGTFGYVREMAGFVRL